MENKMNELTEFQQRACAVGVVKLLNAKHFNICDLEALAKTMGREQMMAGKDHAALRAVHCVDWADMGPELTTMVREKCFELLGLPQAAIDSVCKREAPSEKAHEPAKRLRLAFWK
jgi:hypothetical protein